jgi:hypothetical protein
MRTELKSGRYRIGVIKNFILYVPRDNWNSAVWPDIKMAMAVPTVESSLLRRKLNRSSGVAPHLQIERMLRKLITSPPYSSGALLPDELTLAEKLGVRGGTVRNSILNVVSALPKGCQRIERQVSFHSPFDN